MSRLGRRRFLGCVGIGAMAPYAAFGISAPRVMARQVDVPIGKQFLLTRRLERELVDGNSLVVTRAWTFAFQREEGGISARGSQTSAKVEAPPSLAPFASIEEGRTETGPFPCSIDLNGIMRGNGTKDRAHVDKALELARGIFEGLPEDDLRRMDSSRFLADLSARAASAVSQIPADLFFPEAGTQSVSWPIDLPDGALGRVEVEIESIARAGTGLLRSTDRRVTTSLGDDSRFSTERWTLAPA